MTHFLYSLIAFFCLQLGVAQDKTITVAMDESNWIIPENAEFQLFDNRKTLLLKGKRATVKDLQFENGSIEVDVYANAQRSFAGITFRKQNDNMDEVYMRMHKTTQVDAVQYTPIFNNESNWQLYREYQAKVEFKREGWNTLRLEIANQMADVYINNEKVLTIDHLRSENPAGQVGLFALFSNRFSNFRVTPKDKIEPITLPSTSNDLDETIITQWQITKAKVFDSDQLDYDEFSNEIYTTVNTEKSGLLPISKYVKKTSSGNFEQNKDDYIVAKTTINSGQNETRLFSFDYSDRILIFLNGELMFKGNNSFRTKGVQYMGHLDIDSNLLYLPVKKGINTIHCVIIDKANGWGLMGKLE